MGVYALLKKNRLRFNEELRDSPDRQYFSPSTYSRYRETYQRIAIHVSGKVLDVGCGDMTFRKLVLAHAEEYDGLDIERRAPEVKYVGDVQDMHMIPTESYDAVLCLEVLEHVLDPFQAASEIYRVLRRGGKLIVSVPHLARLHEEPHDFYRYTKYGLQFLLKRAGFQVLEIVPRAGLLSFLGHQVSTLLIGLSWHVPLVKQVVFVVNKWLCVKPCLWLDRMVEKKKVFALGYVAVAQKP